MQKLDWFLPATGGLLQALAGHYFPTLSTTMEASPYEWGDLNAGQMAQASAPAPLTIERVLARVPYMSAAAARAQLEAAAERGVLAPEGEGYALTEAGRAFVDQISELAAGTLHGLEGQIPGASRLADLLGTQVEAICAAPGIEAPCILGSRSFDPGPGAKATTRLRRYLVDLNSWRDDAHVAAWRAHEPQGHAWEAFSHVWGEQVWGDPIATAAEAAEKMGGFRGYDEAAYQQAFDHLAERGWLEAGEDGRYAVTEAGRRLREASEQATDAHYFGPMQLAPAEAEELRGLIETATKALQEKTED